MMRPRPDISFADLSAQLAASFSPSPSVSATVSKPELLAAYEMMLLCRQFENACNQAYMQGTGSSRARADAVATVPCALRCNPKRARGLTDALAPPRAAGRRRPACLAPRPPAPPPPPRLPASAGLIRGFMHLDNGQETIPAMLADCVKQGDIKVSYYREHTHALASGVSGEAIMAEVRDAP
jgi:hypothetical protein